MTITRSYLDHNATTPLSVAARDAMTEAMSEVGNPSSVHAEGRKARALLEHSRSEVAGLFEVDASQVWFTSGATESNNTVIQDARKRGWSVGVSATEHVSVLEAAPDAAKIPVGQTGVVKLEALSEFCSLRNGEPHMISVQAINNETGIIQPLGEVSKVVHAAGGYLHVDAAQAPGKTELADLVSHADVVTLSAHKFGGPKGCGVVILANDELGEPTPLLQGGGQERRRRPGTENLVSIVGTGAAAANVADRLDDCTRQLEMRNRLEHAILEYPGTQIAGSGGNRVANTSCVLHPAIRSELALIQFDLGGVSLSSGSACSSGKVTKSHVLEAMGFEGELLGSALRISLGVESTNNDVDAFLSVWDSILRRANVHPSQQAMATAVA